MRSATTRQARRQRGAAILIAMLVVALVATLAAGLQWRQWRNFQLEAAARAQSQVNWILVGALDWARLILREDALATSARGIADHLGEPWALPLQETKLSTFLAIDSLQEAGQGDVYLSGKITDEQGKINLTNLLSDQDQPHPEAYKMWQRLYQQLALPPSELDDWLARWKAAARTSMSTNSMQTNNRTAPLQPTRIEQLVWLGVPASHVEVLKNYVTILPRYTPINLNTASATVIFAAIPSIDMIDAQKLVAERTAAPFFNIMDASTLLKLPSSSLTNGAFSTNSEYFEVLGRLRLGDWTVTEKSLVHRLGLNVTTIWRSRVS